VHIETFKVFRDLVETTSFSRAAKANGITQSAVSQQVRAIERRFNVRLIERGSRTFQLTPEGRALLAASRNILDAYDELIGNLRGGRLTVDGRLSIATIYSIGLHELPPYLRTFRRQHPRVEVKIDYCRYSEVYDSVRDGACDLGLVAFPMRKPGLKVMTFWRDKLVLICGPNHRLAKKKKAELRDVVGEKFVAFEPDLPTRKAIDKRLRERGVRIRPILEFDNIETVKRAVEIEDAVSIVPETCVRDEVRGDTLMAVEIDEPEMWRPLGAIVKRAATPAPALKEFLSMLEKTELGRQ
jgi:LysR family transcriptional regulator, transcriptional activator of the cysJI operon